MPLPLIGLTSFGVQQPRPRSFVSLSYVRAVTEAGGAPLAIPLGLTEIECERIIDALDGLLLSGGVDVAPERYGHVRHPMLGEVDEERDSLELTLIDLAMQRDLPILGICRGIQSLAVAAGGTLIQDIPSQIPSDLRHDTSAMGRDVLAHSIAIEPQSRLATILGGTQAKVNSLHHQSVLDIPPGFAVSAWSPDGVVEGLESTYRSFVVGVQCHPEEIWHGAAPEFGLLFRAFVDAAEHYSARRTKEKAGVS